MKTKYDAFGLYSRAADGSDERATLLRGERLMIPFSWTPDGQALSFAEAQDLIFSNYDIWTVSLAGERVPYLATPFSEGNHDLSPNGQWLAYNSDESGVLEVYIQPYPEPGEKVTVSTGGGEWPLWSPDGRELFYRNLEGDRMMVVAVSTEPTLRVSRSEVLFEGRYARGDSGLNYDVSADGQRFLMISEAKDDEAEDDEAQDGDAETAPPHKTLIVIENWFEELKRLVPID